MLRCINLCFGKTSGLATKQTSELESARELGSSVLVGEEKDGSHGTLLGAKCSPEKLSNAESHLGGPPAAVGGSTSALLELQLALTSPPDAQSVRVAQLVHSVRQHLGVRVARYYALDCSTDCSTGSRLVLVAAAAARASLSRTPDALLPGWSTGIDGELADGAATTTAAGPSGAETSLLLHRALSRRAPSALQLTEADAAAAKAAAAAAAVGAAATSGSATGAGVGGTSGGVGLSGASASAGTPIPADCVADLLSHGCTLFAAVPLMLADSYGQTAGAGAGFTRRPVGVLWLSCAAVDGTSAVMLRCPTALRHLSIAASLALASSSALPPAAWAGAGGGAGLNALSSCPADAAGCTMSGPGGGVRNAQNSSTIPSTPSCSGGFSVGLASSRGPAAGLAASLRRLHDSSTLHSLVWELGQCVAEQVSSTFLLEPSLLTAFVPHAASATAFMLLPDAPPVRQATPPVPAAAAPASPQQLAAAAAAAAAAGEVRASAATAGMSDSLREQSVTLSPLSRNLPGAPRSATAAAPTPTASLPPPRLPSPSPVPRPLAASATVSRVGPGPSAGAAAAGNRQPTAPHPGSVRVLRLASRVPTASGLLCHAPSGASAAAAVAAAHGAAGSVGLPEGHVCFPEDTVVAAAVDLVGGQAVMSAGSITQAYLAPPTLHAKPFELAHTLLQSLENTRVPSGLPADLSASGFGSRGADSSACAGGSEAAVLSGMALTDVGRWVQDVRQPSRDVFLVMGALPPPQSLQSLALVGLSLGEALDGPSWAPAAQGSRPMSFERMGSGMGGAGGGWGGGGKGVLALYVAFSSPLPPALLDAVRAQVCAVLRLVSPLLLWKLHTELAVELSVLRAGMPGSYTVSIPGPPMSPPPMSPLPLSVANVAESLSPRAIAPAFLTNDTGQPPTAATASRLARVTATLQSGHLMITPEEDPALSTFDGGMPTGGLLDLAASMLGGHGSTNGGLGRGTSHKSLRAPTLRPGSSASGRPVSGAALGRNHPLQVLLATGGSLHHQAASVTGAGGLDSRDTVLSAGRTARSASLVIPADSSHMTPVAVLSVHEVDGSSSLATQMDRLVGAVADSMRAASSSTGCLGAGGSGPAGGFGGPGGLALAGAQEALLGRRFPAEETEELDDLQLFERLGEGGSGMVLRGLMGTTPVAVKLVEIPDAEIRPSVAAVMRAGGRQAAAELQQRQALDARRVLLRSATELAAFKSLSHTNIVQCHAVYESVKLERVPGPDMVLRLTPAAASARPSRPVYTAIVTELCCAGTLASVLMDRSFPRTVWGLSPEAAAALGLGPEGADAASSAGRHATVTASSSSDPRQGLLVMQYDMMSIYATLLEIALALRHMHARRLVHRDLKPANVLLKHSPSDPRGWTCKLADFGFVLVLDQRQATNAPVDVSGSGGLSGASNSTGGSAGRRSDYSRFASAGSFRGQQRAGNRASSMHSAKRFTFGGMVAAVEAPTDEAGPGTPREGEGGSTWAGGNAWTTVQDQACGTVSHMAPEAMRKDSRIDASVDVFSFGIIMWEILAGRGNRPYPTLPPKDIPAAVIDGLRPAFPADTPASYRELAQACWAAEPWRRPRASELVANIKALLVQQQQLLLAAEELRLRAIARQ